MYAEILVPTNGSKGMAKVVATALDLAEQNGARVHALHVVDPAWEKLLYDEYSREALFARGEAATREIAEEAEYRGLESVRAVREGIPHEVIVEYSGENDVDLVVLGTEKPTALIERVAEAVIEALLGGTTENVVRNAPASVITVRI